MIAPPPAERVPIERDVFGVSDARALAEQCSRRPGTGTLRVLVVSAREITNEAQNALLKLFEEPPATTRIVLAVPSDAALLPTLRSRLADPPPGAVDHDAPAVVSGTAAAEQSMDAWSSLLALSLADRLTEIERRLKAKDTEWVATVAADIRRVVRDPTVSHSLAPAVTALLTRYLSTRGASNKQLLELAVLAAPDTSSR